MFQFRMENRLTFIADLFHKELLVETNISPRLLLSLGVETATH